MPYTTGPYALDNTAEPPSRADISSSREIDFAIGDYVLDSNGGFTSMSSTAQRVMLLVSYAVKPGPLITPQELNKAQDNIRKALDVMTRGPEPAIRIKTISATRTSAGRVRVHVDFADLTTGLSQTVERT